jgi:hypothetical protein
MQVAEAGRTLDLIGCNAMNGDIVWIEIFARVHKLRLRTNFLAIFEVDHANLADAAHSRIGRLNIDRNKPHWRLLSFSSKAARGQKISQGAGAAAAGHLVLE